MTFQQKYDTQILANNASYIETKNGNCRPCFCITNLDSFPLMWNRYSRNTSRRRGRTVNLGLEFCLQPCFWQKELGQKQASMSCRCRQSFILIGPQLEWISAFKFEDVTHVTRDGRIKLCPIILRIFEVMVNQPSQHIPIWYTSGKMVKYIKDRYHIY